MSEESYNFISNLTKEEQKLLRKRVIGLILSTDMAKHATQVSNINSKLASLEIDNGENLDKLINDELDRKQLFEN